jgi:hypothetical protein
MEPGGLELASRGAERGDHGFRNRHVPLGQNPIHIEHAESNPFEVERGDRADERLAFGTETSENLGVGIGRDQRDDGLDVFAGGLSMIHKEEQETGLGLR